MSDQTLASDIAARIASLPPDKRALLEKRLLEKRVDPIATKIPIRPDQTHWPLSFTQESLWFLSQLVPDTDLYNRPVALRLRGALNQATLHRSLGAVIQRHDTLRSAYRMVDNYLEQSILPSVVLDLHIIDLGGLDKTAQQVELFRQLNDQAHEPFSIADLTQGLPLHAVLFSLGPDDHTLLVTFHHIIFDGWSARVFIRELTSLYTAFSIGTDFPLPPLPIQYADYVVWQQEHLGQGVMERHLAYWRSQLNGASPLQIPTDRIRSTGPTYGGAIYRATLPRNLTDGLKAIGQRYQATPFMVVFAAFNALLYRYTGQEDICVGTLTAGRTRTELEGLIGNFLNTLVARTQLSGEIRFDVLLGRIRENILAALEHQQLPFDQLVRELQPSQNRGRSPFFEILFNFENVPPRAVSIPGLSVEEIDPEIDMTRLDLSVEITESADGYVCHFQYSTDLFNADTIQRMVAHFETILTAVTANPEQAISALPILTETERQRMLVEWNATQADFPADQTLHTLFASLARRVPESVAVIAEEQSITFGELNCRANQLAHYLRGLGVQTGDRIGLCLSSSIDLIIALFGAMKAGVIYVPLDPTYPVGRLLLMLDDSGAKMLVTAGSTQVGGFARQVINLDIEQAAIAKQPDSDPPTFATSGDPVYMVYTSGSTGASKGVVVEHRSLVNHVVAVQKVFEMQPTDRMLHTTSISFDFSAQQIYVPLLSGGTLVLLPGVAQRPTADFLGEADAYGITVLDIPTTLWHEIVLRLAVDGLRLPESVRLVVMGAERMIPERLEMWWRQVGSRVKLLHGYGPTEGTIACTFGTMDTEAQNAHVLHDISVGWPIANTEIYILDGHQQPVPVGVSGELYIGGLSVARGYWHRPELTAERFIPHPFNSDAGARLYRTGDLARFRADGSIEILGRADSQVKVRGYRIELGEIEAALVKYPAVQDVVVHVWEDDTLDKRIVAYVVAKPDAERSSLPVHLRSFLSDSLPRFMLPSAFVMLDALPLTLNGKLNRKALPAPSISDPQPDEDFASPRDEVEYHLVEIWEELLARKPISIRANFFEVGGHSLLLLRLIAMIEKSFGVSLPVATFFQAGTIEQIAPLLRQAPLRRELQFKPSGSSTLVVIQPGDPASGRLPLFCLPPLFGGVYSYRKLAQLIGTDQPVIGVQAKGMDGTEPPLNRIEDMAAFYFDQIRTIQPNGPYYLCGYSFGGTIAYQMACQLRRQGESVALLAIIDTPFADFRRLRKQSNRWLQNGPFRLAISVASFTFMLQHLPPTYFRQYLRERVSHLSGSLLKRLHNQPETQPALLIDAIDLYLTPAIRSLRSAALKAQYQYRPEPYDGPTVYFRSNSGIINTLVFKELYRLCRGGVDIYDIPGNHFSVMDDENIVTIAEITHQYIDHLHLGSSLVRKPSASMKPHRK